MRMVLAVRIVVCRVYSASSVACVLSPYASPRRGPETRDGLVGRTAGCVRERLYNMYGIADQHLNTCVNV